MTAVCPETRPLLFGWPLSCSLVVHAMAFAVASGIVVLHPASPRPEPVPIEVVRLEPSAPPAESARPAAVPVPPKLRHLDPLTPPRAVAPRALAPAADPSPAVPTPDPVPAPPALLDEARHAESAPPADARSHSGQQLLAGAMASPAWSMPGASGGSSRASGTLLPAGDLPIPAASGAPTGGTGRSGESTGPAGAAGGDPSAPNAPRIAATGNPTGLTSFARPAGGYQTRPRYPESARRQGIEGEALLRFEVLPTGRVASISVARSAGHPDLDRAAMAAVETWRFEPARRGKEAVAVWVTLPVRFHLQDGVAQ